MATINPVAAARWLRNADRHDSLSLFSRARVSFRKDLMVMTYAAILAASGCGVPGNVRTESDFSTRESEVRFLEQYLPFSVPATANDIHFHFVDYRKWTLTCSFSAGAADVSAIMWQVQREPFQPDERNIDNELLSGYWYLDKATHRGTFVAVNLDANRVLIRSYGD